ncbi:MAG: cupin domain-containing protein, partial [Deltaproteobacteria bacterium]|nr:cupin domain-containing protein [Deltaproteobacteria bacterium]
FIHLDLEAFNNCRSESIDYALMERSDCVAVVPADVGWSDVGSWAALYEVLNKDAQGNAVHGDVILKGVANSLVHSEGRLVAAVGLENMLVVETHDAVLVAPLDRSQEVRKIVPDLKAANRQEYLLHQTAHRPWGTYTVLEEHPGFKIKRITVKPGARLSLLMHHHRSEHWIAVRGTARVTRGKEVFLLRENESTYIPAGEKHRLENPGSITLELIEVQNGSYLGEDDIIRFDDQYGRLSKS